MSNIISIDKNKYKPDELLKDIESEINQTEHIIVIRIMKDGHMNYSNTNIKALEAIGMMETIKDEFILEFKD